MSFLLISILLNVWIFIAFRSFAIYKIPTLQAVVFNYFVCSITGFFFSGEPIQSFGNFSMPWVPFAIFLGLIFIVAFYAMAITTQKLGVTIASIAARMSMIIPVIFALFIFNLNVKQLSLLNYCGIILSLIALVLSSLKKKSANKTNHLIVIGLLLPMLVFILQGSIDTLLNYVNYKYITPKDESVFPVYIFFTAGTLGALFLLFRREKFHWKSVVGGLYLGLPNYFSVYFILKSLSAFNNDGALIFPIFNTGVIVLSAVIAMIFFREKISLMNKVGLILAILSIYLISYQEIHINLIK